MARRLRFSLFLAASAPFRVMSNCRSPASDGSLSFSAHDTATPCATMCVFSCIFFYTCTACTRALRLLRARAQSVTSFDLLALPLDELCKAGPILDWMPKLVAVRLVRAEELLACVRRTVTHMAHTNLRLRTKRRHQTPSPALAGPSASNSVLHSARRWQEDLLVAYGATPPSIIHEPKESVGEPANADERVGLRPHGHATQNRLLPW